MKYIYAIQHNQTKRIYVGCTKNITNRYIQHMQNLKSGRHASEEIQHDFDEFGEDFSVFLLEEIDKPSVLVEAENGRLIRADRKAEFDWMKKYKTIYEGYNRQDGRAKKYIENDYSYPIEITLKQGLPDVNN